MTTEIPPLRFPLFALFVLGKGLLCTPRDVPGKKDKIKSIILCTHRAIARMYAVDMKLDAQPVVINNVDHLRRLLEDDKSGIEGISVDPDVEVARKHVQFVSFHFVAAILDQVMQHSFTWTFPLFVVQSELDSGKFAAFTGTSAQGKSVKGVAVFTDEDLAERYMAAGDGEGIVRPLSDVRAFSDFLRHQSSKAVFFDPSKLAKGMTSRVCMDVATLLRQLP